MLEKWITFIKGHEKMLLVAIAGLVLWFAIGRVDTLIANHDNAALQQAKVVAQAQIEKNAALSAQVAQNAADMKALNDKVQAQNAQLEQANIALANALVKQQKTDAAMTPTELTSRWNVLVPSAGATVTPNGVTLPDAGAHATVAQLEKVPVLETQLSNTKGQLTNEGALVAESQKQVTTLNAEVTGLNLQIVDDHRVCDARVKVEVDKTRKARRRWFIIGWVTGFISRQFIKTETGF